MTATRQPLFSENGEQDSMKSLDVVGTTGGKATVENTVETPKHQALAAIPEADRVVSMFERLAKDPSVDVAKLEKLIGMQERIIAVNARAEFYAAFAAMQGEIPTISENGEILVNGVVRSRYPRNEDIQEVVKPILQKHGFALTFRTEFKDGLVKVIGILAHRSGHTEQDEFVSKADDSGSKNAIQALGSTRSYGQRYTTIALLNIASRDPRDHHRDDDGAQSEAKAVQAPVGFEDWLIDMTAVADNGMKALTDCWNKSKPEYRRHLTSTNLQGWEQLKKRAAAVKA